MALSGQTECFNILLRETEILVRQAHNVLCIQKAGTCAIKLQNISGLLLCQRPTADRRHPQENITTFWFNWQYHNTLQKPSRPALWSIQPPVRYVREFFHRNEAAGCDWTTYVQPVPRLSMSGSVILPLLYDFVAWTGTTVPFTTF